MGIFDRLLGKKKQEESISESVQELAQKAVESVKDEVLKVRDLPWPENEIFLAEQINKAYKHLNRKPLDGLSRQALAELSLTKGVQFEEKGNHAKALSNLMVAIEMNPQYTEAYYNLGCIYYKFGLKLHEPYIGRTILDPPELDTYLREKERVTKYYNKAIDMYKKAIQLDPEFSLAYAGLGPVYHNLKKDEEAKKALKKAIELDPNGPGGTLAKKNLDMLGK